jgi:hypothetical protein
MPTSPRYPSQPIEWTDQTDVTNRIYAQHINQLYADFIAMEKDLKRVIYYTAVAAVSDVFTLDAGESLDFLIETLDANAKTIAITNVPQPIGGKTPMVMVTINVKYTNGADITFPSGIVWQNGLAPYFNTGKQTIVYLVSYDSGATWLGSFTGEW